MVISKRSYGHGAQKSIPLVGAKSALTCAGPQTTSSNGREYKAENGNLEKSGATFCHGAVFAPKQYLYQKEEFKNVLP